MKESKEINHTGKRVKLLTKVIQNPDTYNVNIASREGIEGLEQRVRGIEAKLSELINAIKLLTPIWNEHWHCNNTYNATNAMEGMVGWVLEAL